MIFARRQLRSAGWLLTIALTTASADERPQSTADMIATLQTSVVSISVTRITKTEAPAGNIVSQDSVAEKKFQSSGFFVDASGVILTNQHVIVDESDIIVTLHDTSRLRASIMAADTTNDIALLKVNAGKTVPALKFGNSELLRPGDPVFIIGNPLGLGSTVTAGIVSALDRNTAESESASFFQIDAALNTGNSGGPVFNKEGDLVGVSTALVTPEHQGGSVGLGLAIPGNDARFIMDRLRAFGRVQLGWIGIHVQPVTADIAAALRLPVVSGSIITRIDDDSPAARAHLTDGDIILKVDSDEMPGPRVLNRKIASIVKGNINRISIWRAGTQQTISVTIDLQPVNSPAKPLVSNLQEKPHIDRRDLGLTLAPLPDDVRAKLSMPAQGAGVLVEGVALNSVASDRGVTVGSVIVKVERRSVTSPGEVLRSIEDARQSNRAFVMLLIANTQGLRWIPLPL